MKIALSSNHSSPYLSEITRALCEIFRKRGHEVLEEVAPEETPPETGLILNVTDSGAPKANYIRSSPANFVCTFADTDQRTETLRTDAYRVLIKTLSNLLIYGVGPEEERVSCVVTPELGFREIPHNGDHVSRIADQILALAKSEFVIENELVEDLPPSLREGDDVTAALARAGKRLDGIGLLPSVLPLSEILDDRERRLLMKVFGVKQISYGNLSARHDGKSFWMSGRGVDKSNLRKIGSDILLVTGFDAEHNRMRLSVPPGTDPTSRVSVDAIEHYLIYEAFPDVGAIVHVHAWLPGIESTLQNYPCGTRELADEVLELVRRAPDPANAIVGLKNHGITATGPDIETLFESIGPRLLPQVPMV